MHLGHIKGVPKASFYSSDFFQDISNQQFNNSLEHIRFRRVGEYLLNEKYFLTGTLDNGVEIIKGVSGSRFHLLLYSI